LRLRKINCLQQGVWRYWRWMFFPLASKLPASVSADVNNLALVLNFNFKIYRVSVVGGLFQKSQQHQALFVGCDSKTRYISKYMTNKIILSIDSLTNWTEKLLLEGHKGSWTLQDFIETFDVKSYQKFYIELIPFITELTDLNNQEISKLASDYLKNKDKLQDSLMPNTFALFDIFTSWAKVDNSRRIDNFLLVLTDIKNNTSNFIYQLKINTE
jgi:hypothetical protein